MLPLRRRVERLITNRRPVNGISGMVSILRLSDISKARISMVNARNYGWQIDEDSNLMKPIVFQ